MLVTNRGGEGQEALWSADGWQVYKKRLPNAIPVRLETRPTGGGSARPTAIAAGSSSLWIALTLADEVRKAPLTRYPRVLLVAEVKSPTAVAVGAGAVWVASASTGRVWRVDPETGKAKPVLHIGLRITGIAVSGGSVWITTGDSLKSAKPYRALAYQRGRTLQIPGFPANKQPELMDATMPAWSPDGKQIAFASNRDGDWDIYRVDADGVQNLTDNRGEGSDLAPSWSPDGSRIAYATKRDGDFDIWTMASDGTDDQPLTTGSGFDSFPAWSPDGMKIAYLSDADGTVPMQAFTMATDGSTAEPVDQDGGPSGAPAWSPDGASVAFWSGLKGGGIAVAKPGVGVQSVASLPLTRSDYTRVSVSWSPDGRYIAYSAPSEGRGSTIYVMYADGTGGHALTDPGPNAQYPAWRPELP
jgi:dipeptidyl aminopeptidase/acylaminoacyl peptidase